MYKRSEVYLIREDAFQVGSEIKKTRPWVIVGANQVNAARGTLIAIPLSTQAKEIPGLSIKVYVNGIFVFAVIDQLRALDKKRIIQLEGCLSTHEMDLIDDGLREVLGLK